MPDEEKCGSMSKINNFTVTDADGKLIEDVVAINLDIQPPIIRGNLTRNLPDRTEICYFNVVEMSYKDGRLVIAVKIIRSRPLEAMPL